jgi:pyruvate dehydrogenase E2 component (dihydrolipoamide acetyltransferase)
MPVPILMPILMPALSATMEEGRLAKWLVKAGDIVQPGNIIAEIETDKATMEVEALDEGVVAEILVMAGTEKVRVNTPIALLRMAGAVDAPTLVDPASAVVPVATPRPELPTHMPQTHLPPTINLASVAPCAEKPVITSPAPPAAAASAGDQPGDLKPDRRFISPLAHRLAHESKLDVTSLQGSGPDGRVVQRDAADQFAASDDKSDDAGAGARATCCAV